MSVTIGRVYIGTEYSMLSMIVNSIRYSGGYSREEVPV